jgi:hypothetical protein
MTEQLLAAAFDSEPLRAAADRALAAVEESPIDVEPLRRAFRDGYTAVRAYPDIRPSAGTRRWRSTGRRWRTCWLRCDSVANGRLPPSSKRRLDRPHHDG